MHILDIIVLVGALLFIVLYGVWKTRGSKNIESYLRGDNSMKWGTIGLSVMATQASAITFISTPGQAYESGMGFVQNYFGLPIALIVVSAVFIPIYYKLKVYTAYEYLEHRFDAKTRYLGAFLFLVQRGLAAGITIYAPAIIVSSMMGWNLSITIIATGVLVIIYTVSGGTKAVSVTQKQQMAVIMIGMFAAFFILMSYITQHVSFVEALGMAGSLGKLNAVNFEFDIRERYNVWSGLTGGFFLALSYFGTDQSQVQRYLGGQNVTASRMGMMFNAILKIPMQFFILFIGAMVYVFYVFNASPMHFKKQNVEAVMNSVNATQYKHIESKYEEAWSNRKNIALGYPMSDEVSAKGLVKLREADDKLKSLRKEAKELIKKTNGAETKDSDYVFLTFIVNYLPHGLIGLLLAVIFSAAMSSTSSELNALASTSSVDFYKRLVKKDGSDAHYLKTSRLLTLGWGILAILFALLAQSSENLIEAVNIIGSIFYGTILGIFLVAFFLKKTQGNAVFYAALIAQTLVIICHFLNQAEVFNIGYLWYNAIGCGVTVLLSWVLGRIGK